MNLSNPNSNQTCENQQANLHTASQNLQLPESPGPSLQFTFGEFKEFFSKKTSEDTFKNFLAVLNQLHDYALKDQKINATLFSNYIAPNSDINESLSHFFSPKNDTPALLVLGDSGTGKSMLAKRIVWEAWKNFKPGDNIPLFIPLARISTYGVNVLESQLLPRALTTYLDEDGTLIKYLKSYGRWTLVLDGYDEIGYKGNLFETNNLSEWGDIKLITTCRPEALPEKKSTYLHWFGDPQQENLVWDVTLPPFDDGQISEYLRNYTAKEHADIANQNAIEGRVLLSVEQKWELLASMPSVKALATNPFILTQIVPALTELHQKSQQLNSEGQQLSRAEVYEVFISRWFLEQAQRIKAQGYFKQLKMTELTSLLHCYSENLAHTCLKEGRLDIEINNPTTLDVNLLKARYADQFGLSESKRKELAQDKKQEEIKALRSGCLLKTCDGGFNFIHKSLIEYFAARDLFNGVIATTESIVRELIKAKENNGSPSFAENLLREPLKVTYADKCPSFHEQIIEEPQILRLLVSGVQKRSHFKAALWETIEASKYNPYLATASANAITLLNLAGESFAGKDLQYARFPKANLYGSNLSGANLQYVDARDVNFTNACLLNCNLTAANFTGAEFGQAPQLGEQINLGLSAFASGAGEFNYNGTSISSACFSPDGKQIALMATGAFLRIYNTETWKPKIIPIQKFVAGGLSVDSLCYSPDGNYLFFGAAVPSPIHKSLRFILLELKKNYHKTTLAKFGKKSFTEKKWFGEAHQHNIQLTFSPDSQWCASTHYDDQINQTILAVYSSKKKKIIAQLRLPTSTPVQKIIFSDDNKQLFILSQLLSSDSKTAEILVFNITPLKLVSCRTFDASILTACWHGAQIKYAIANQNGITVYLDDTLLWQKTIKNTVCLAFLKNSELLAFANEQKIWQLWDIKNEKFLYAGQLDFIPNQFITNISQNQIAWLRESSEIGKYFEVDKVRSSGQASVWSLDENTEKDIKDIKVTHLRDLASNSPTTLSPSGKFLLTLSGTKSCANTVANLFRLNHKETYNILPQQLYSERLTINPYLQLVDPLLEQQKDQYQTLTSPNKEYVAAINGLNVKVTTKDGKDYAAFNCLNSQESELITLAFSLDSQYLAVGIFANKQQQKTNNTCFIQIWSIQTKKLYCKFERNGLMQKIDELTLHFAELNQQPLLASIIPNKKIKIHSLKNKNTYLSVTPAPLQTNYLMNIFTGTISPNGQWVAWSDANNSLHIHSLNSKKVIYRVMRAHQATINKLSFNSDSGYLFSIDTDNRYCLWQLVTENHNFSLQLAYTNKPLLNLANANITQTLGLSATQIHMFNQAKAIGKPNNALSHHISREMRKRNAREKVYDENPQTIFATDFMISPSLGAVYLATLKGDAHSFIILEYVDQGNYRCFEKFDFVLNTDKKIRNSGIDVTGTGQIRIMSVDQADIITKSEKECYVGLCLGNLTLKQMEHLRACVYRDANALLKYSRNGRALPSPTFFKKEGKNYNCFGWCKKILREIGVSLTRLEAAKNASLDIKEKAIGTLVDNPKLYLTEPLELNSEFKEQITSLQI